MRPARKGSSGFGVQAHHIDEVGFSLLEANAIGDFFVGLVQSSRQFESGPYFMDWRRLLVRDLQEKLARSRHAAA